MPKAPGESAFAIFPVISITGENLPDGSRGTC